MNEFDDLFNEFFSSFYGRRNNRMSSIQDEIRKIMDSLYNFNPIDQNKMEDLSSELGEPDEKQTFEKDGFIIEKLIWNTPHGQLVKIIASEKDGKPKQNKVKEKSLEEQLKEAVQAENYELAIELRDKIKNQNKPKRGRKKKSTE